MQLLYVSIVNRMGESSDNITFDLALPLKGQSQGHSEFEALYHVKEQS